MLLIIGLIAIIVFLIIYYYRKNNREYFSNSIEELSYEIINDQEKAFEILTNDDYLNSFNKVDYYARDIIPPTKSTYRQILKHKIKIINEKEKQAFDWMIESFKQVYPAIVSSSKSKIWNFFLFNFNLIKGEEIDGRLPHTHGNTIIFDQEYFDELVENYRKNEVSRMLTYQSETLVHEMAHLLERNNQTINDMFQNIYLELGFLPILPDIFKNIIPDKYRFRIRSNPDELPNLQFYWWKKDPNDNIFYLPLALYSSEKPSDLTDVEMVLLLFKMEDEKFLYQKKINIDNSDYQEFLGIRNNNYHPKEILPEYLARWYLSIIEGSSLGIDMEAKGFKIFNDYLIKQI